MHVKNIEIKEYDGKFFAALLTQNKTFVEEGSTALEALGNLLFNYHGNFGVDSIKNVGTKK